jgi:hypothetical protein
MAKTAPRRRGARPGLPWPKLELPPWQGWAAIAGLSMEVVAFLVPHTVELAQKVVCIAAIGLLPIVWSVLKWSVAMLVVLVQRGRWY